MTELFRVFFFFSAVVCITIITHARMHASGYTYICIDQSINTADWNCIRISKWGYCCPRRYMSSQVRQMRVILQNDYLHSTGLRD
ncbi:hypothetical protein PILCRDRAFT_692720 [Piloderma croceum F 1598]|uniref:Uncharacterized protein n=1 Tax=Piloderma croceum (strain F 1598) TaxID=765440 RepID=A0A0C3EQL7_PILCF|nr:hypothetical protein PILCRDRAFT_692720 [Piloderma croceum F 1598]